MCAQTLMYTCFRGFQKCFEARHVLSKKSLQLVMYVIIFSIGNVDDDDDDDISWGARLNVFCLSVFRDFRRPHIYTYTVYRIIH